MKIKTHLAYAFLFCALGTAVIGCSKDKEDQAPAEVSSKIDPAKLKRIEKYMILMLGVSPDAKMYDEVKEEFYIHDQIMNRAEMERYYDNATEYKLRYEKN